MKAEETKKEFARTLLDLVAQHPLERISISMVIDACCKNRNTFYYHFQDKVSLMLWIFRNDLGERLAQANDNVDLVFEKNDPPFSHSPYYAREITGIRTVNNSFFMKSLFETLETRHDFYFQMFSDVFRKDVENHLFSLFVNAMSTDLDIILSGRYLSNNDRMLIVNYHASGLLGFVENALSNPVCTLNNYKNTYFLNLIPDSMSFEVENKRF